MGSVVCCKYVFFITCIWTHPLSATHAPPTTYEPDYKFRIAGIQLGAGFVRTYFVYADRGLSLINMIIMHDRVSNLRRGYYAIQRRIIRSRCTRSFLCVGMRRQLFAFIQWMTDVIRNTRTNAISIPIAIRSRFQISFEETFSFSVPYRPTRRPI